MALQVVPVFVERLQQQAHSWHQEDRFASLEHQPKHWPQLLRGRGLLASRGPYHDKQHRRLTVDKIRQGVGATPPKPFVLQTGARGPFASTFVLPQRKFEDYDQEPMQLFAELFFAESLEECHNLFPKTDGVASWSTLRTLLSKYTVCARKAASGAVLDLGREGMIKGISEHSEYLKFLLGIAAADFASIRPQRQTNSGEGARAVQFWMVWRLPSDAERTARTRRSRNHRQSRPCSVQPHLCRHCHQRLQQHNLIRRRTRRTMRRRRGNHRPFLSCRMQLLRCNRRQ